MREDRNLLFSFVTLLHQRLREGLTHNTDCIDTCERKEERRHVSSDTEQALCTHESRVQGRNWGFLCEETFYHM